jgi:predicted Zn-dependent protease
MSGIPMIFFRKLSVVCSTVFALLVLSFPQTGTAITVRQEEDLSKKVMEVVKNQFELIKDPLIVSYINKTGHRIVSSLPPQPFNYRFYVIKSDVYNAFATPAGHIFINSGLLGAMDSEEELAGILAHEIAHVVCRHISQKIERSKKINLATLAGVAAGALLGAGGSGAAANAVTAGSLAAGQSVALAYSREDESQADYLALEYLEKARYNASGLYTMLKKIRSRQWFGSEQFPTYLRTHPASEERMVTIGAYLEQNADSRAKADAYEFQRAHTRLIAVYGEEESALKRFKSAVDNDPGNPLAHYGYGLVLARRGLRKDAIRQFQFALEKKAFDAYILRDLGIAYLADGQYASALDALESATDRLPSDPEGCFYFGQTLIELGRYRDAVSAFERVLDKFSEYNQANYYLGEAYSRLERFGYAHYYLGIYYKNKNERRNAVFHLNKAFELIDDTDKKLAAEQMLKEIEKERRSEKQKKAG